MNKLTVKHCGFEIATIEVHSAEVADLFKFLERGDTAPNYARRRTARSDTDAWLRATSNWRAEKFTEAALAGLDVQQVFIDRLLLVYLRAVDVVVRRRGAPRKRRDTFDAEFLPTAQLFAKHIANRITKIRRLHRADEDSPEADQLLSSMLASYTPARRAVLRRQILSTAKRREFEPRTLAAKLLSEAMPQYTLKELKKRPNKPPHESIVKALAQHSADRNPK